MTKYLTTKRNKNMYIINALGKYDIDEIDIEKDNK